MKQFIPYTKQQKDVAFGLACLAAIILSIIYLATI
jgi:hypothetical protein